ncbi:hypothetical protein FHR38_004504 [Micromonospora polyrhachis]|uniref:Uncharacterized protein n=1 Tax=Micromonospora polyrhachis TaxID=1282883 RepID=A0A7W7STW5_9ACTN|nr:hypothetical protein [Micromonospora polyrhachis]
MSSDLIVQRLVVDGAGLDAAIDGTDCPGSGGKQDGGLRNRTDT